MSGCCRSVESDFVMGSQSKETNTLINMLGFGGFGMLILGAIVGVSGGGMAAAALCGAGLASFMAALLVAGAS